MTTLAFLIALVIVLVVSVTAMVVPLPMALGMRIAVYMSLLPCRRSYVDARAALGNAWRNLDVIALAFDRRSGEIEPALVQDPGFFPVHVPCWATLKVPTPIDEVYGMALIVVTRVRRDVTGNVTRLDVRRISGD